MPWFAPEVYARERELRLLEAYELNPSIKKVLRSKGFKYTGEIINLSAQELSSTPEVKLLKALDLLHKEKHESSSIYTSIPFLNTLFNGQGLPTRCIIEVCGQSGTGKSQLCMQIASYALFNKILQPQLNYYSIYIDTEGGFDTRKMKSIANATLENLGDSLKILDFTEQISLIKQLNCFISNLDKNVKVIIIDSIAMHYRGSFPDMKRRAGIISATLQELRSLAYTNNLTIIVSNHITTKFFNYSGQSNHTDNLITAIAPALGEIWASAPNHRILLYWEGCNRYAKMVKSSRFPVISAPYSITDAGIS